MFLKNKNIIFKIRRSKVTDYAALSMGTQMDLLNSFFLSFLIWVILAFISETAVCKGGQRRH